jgi:hypothetical protein
MFFPTTGVICTDTKSHFKNLPVPRSKMVIPDRPTFVIYTEDELKKKKEEWGKQG